MAGLDPAIQQSTHKIGRKVWMAGSSPAMTEKIKASV